MKSMVEVEQINIDILMPQGEVSFVAMQPFIRLHSETEEPFRWSEEAAEDQLVAIRRTLDLSQNGFDGSSANFTLFPEYSIPGIPGAKIINDRVAEESWPNSSVIIAGIHGLTKQEYMTLCSDIGAIVSNANNPNSVPINKWVNCCLTWVKDRNGVVKKWVQPKIKPAWPERNVTCYDMFCGSTIYVFNCNYTPTTYPCTFFSLVCFDWVAATGSGMTVCDEVLFQLNEQCNKALKPIHWIFVIQHNPKPNDPSFLNSTNRFLSDITTFPFIDRQDAVVLHANTAASKSPSRIGSGGFSSCIFSPRAQFSCDGCRPTVCMNSSILRDSTILNRCKDVIFREMGECIHLFKVRVPHFVISDVTDRTHPLPDAQVHPATEKNDPRLSRGPVPAAIKWINDSLDEVPALSETTFAGRPLQNRAEEVGKFVIAGMRSYSAPSAIDCIHWAACSLTNGTEPQTPINQKIVDLWGKPEAEGLKHVVHSLISLGLTYNLDVIDKELHGKILSDKVYVQIVAIRGETPQACSRHYDKYVPKPMNDPVLVIASHPGDFSAEPDEFKTFLEADSENGLEFLEYCKLATCCRGAEDENSLKESLDDFLPKHNRII